MGLKYTILFMGAIILMIAGIYFIIYGITHDYTHKNLGDYTAPTNQMTNTSETPNITGQVPTKIICNKDNTSCKLWYGGE